MAETYDLILKGGTVVNQDGTEVIRGDATIMVEALTDA